MIKNILLVVFIFLAAYTVQGQSNYPNLDLYDGKYEIKGSFTPYSVYSFTITDKSNSSEQSFSLNIMDKDNFVKLVTAKCLALNSSLGKEVLEKIKTEALKLFYYYISYERTIVTEQNKPIAGEVTFNPVIYVSVDQLERRTVFKDKLKKGDKKVSNNGITLEKTKSRLIRKDKYTIKDESSSVFNDLLVVYGKKNALNAFINVLNGKAKRELNEMYKQLEGMKESRDSISLKLGILNQVEEILEPLDKISSNTILLINPADSTIVSKRLENKELGLGNADLLEEVIAEQKYLNSFKKDDSVKESIELLEEISSKRKELDSLIQSYNGSHLTENLNFSNVNLRLNDLTQAQKTINNQIQSQSKNISNQEVNDGLKRFKVEEVEFEINDGYMKRIEILGKIETPFRKSEFYNFNNSGTIIFENQIPIGFSRTMDLKELNNIYFFNNYAISNRSLSLHLTDVLELYNKKMEVDRNDFSPEDQIVIYKPIENKTSKKVLYKESSKKILEAEVYTDFVGINETNPNGLVQTEVKKEIILNTSRYRPSKFFQVNFSWFEAITPSITLSKLEENNKNLPLQFNRQILNGENFNIKHASTLELRRYEALSMGFKLKYLTIDVPYLKATLYGNLGIRYGITNIKDSLVLNADVEEYKVNSFQIIPEFSVKFQGDERYGLELGYRINYFNIYTDKFLQLSKKDISNQNFSNDWCDKLLHNTEIRVFYQPSNPSKSNGRWYLRYRLFWEAGNTSANFSQLQFGYSFFLLKNEPGMGSSN
ncbi:synaptonemal complex protein 1 [Mangrovivirga cuniculi]|uniref:Outer membrane protein beta-barrel domain-containing protein n=1 Tax=Mangrovivirga cuniculi TaxID=2715131 RepID=A0A4D7JVP7_9BACT|nr:hypothetical protein [Mangrovivirga cuniculi]QCK16246.1 hypothetical protein DCC35_16610 [Mangrovivirga cuniculi]